MTLRFEDGLAYVKNAPDESFDLIIVDSTDPISVGEGLFTMDFYQGCYRVLKKDGILINQHESPFYEQDAWHMRRAHKRLKRFFRLRKCINTICQRIHPGIGYLVLPQKHMTR